jgi:chloramphenicol 3-O phosphotransferase
LPAGHAERRERERGDRSVGAARGHHGLVHTFKNYDVEVDTSVATSEECAQTILATLDARPDYA